jgi:hypothetical protein
MNKFIPLIGAAALVAVASLSATAPAAAQWYGHGGYYGHGYNRGYYGPGPAIGAGILGFAAGAAIAGAAANNYQGAGWRDHVAACEDAYRSYDVRSDTYLGYDNYRHRCTL